MKTKHLIMLAVVAGGAYWLYSSKAAAAPPPPPKPFAPVIPAIGGKVTGDVAAIAASGLGSLG